MAQTSIVKQGFNITSSTSLTYVYSLPNHSPSIRGA